jgi:hypothetical protein
MKEILKNLSRHTAQNAATNAQAQGEALKACPRYTQGNFFLYEEVRYGGIGGFGDFNSMGGYDGMSGGRGGRGGYGYLLPILGPS